MSDSGIEPARKRIRFNTGVDAFLAEHSLRPRVLDYEKAGFAALLNSGDYKHLDLRDLIATLVYIVDGPQGAEHLIDGQMKTYKCTVLAADHEGATEATSWKQFRIEKGDYRVVILIDLHERCSNVPMSDVDRGLAAQDADIKLVYGEAENWFEELGRCFWRLQESPECSFGPDGTFWGSEWADAPDYNKHESWIMDLTAKLVLDKIIKRAK